MQIKEGDEWKAAFQTNQGLFEPTIMFFGLCNSPMTFQMMMNDILQDFIHNGVSGITRVELHQNPSYKCINRGPAKWALATLELICAMRVVIVEDELR